MRIRLSQFFVLFFLTLIITTDTVAHDDDLIEGNGILKSELRSLPSFNLINISGSYEVELTHGESQSFEVTVDENILPLIKAEVKDKALMIYSKKPFSTESRPRLVIRATSLMGINLQGMNNVFMKGVDTDEFAITSGGADTVSASGKVKTLVISTAGNADIDAQNLKAELVDVSVGGVSNAHVYASKTLSAKVVGVGNIFYSGHPENVTRDVLGIGEITSVQ